MSDPGMSAGPRNLDLDQVADALRRLGYDIEPAEFAARSGSSFIARRETADRATLVTVDAGGRVRVELTWLVGEWPSQTVIGGVQLRVVDSVTRRVDAAGMATTTDQLLSLCDHLEALAPRATQGG